MIDDGTATTGSDNEPLTLEKLKAAVEKLPRIVGYAVVVPGPIGMGCMYTMPPPEGSRYKKVVIAPRSVIERLRAEFGDRPSAEYCDAFEYPLYADPPKPQCIINWSSLS